MWNYTPEKIWATNASHYISMSNKGDARNKMVTETQFCYYTVNMILL